MCGIAGVYNFNELDNVNENNLIKMRDVLHHRGPDFGSHFIDKNVGLAHRRLSIIDLSELGNQPMISEDERYVIVFNGEIYNFKDLKEDLLKKGIEFKSSSDTEVLLKLFIEEGVAMLHKLNGMFAFVIWDKKEKELTAVRDRVGIKPFYYVQNSTQFLFASEPKAIFKYGFPLEVDDVHFGELLLYRFVAGENTLFKNVKVLLPGHYIKIKMGGNFSITRWWKLSDQIKKHPTIHKPVEWFRSTFDDAINKHMIADVPVGVLLSGGLDSSSICASLYSQNYHSIQTFNVGFNDFIDDESQIAGRLSKGYDYKFHSITVENEDLAENLSIANYIHNIPLIHQNEPQIVAISRHAKRHITVLLSGEGSDEIMGGYVRYKALRYLGYKNLIRLMLSMTPKKLKSYRIEKIQRYFNLTDFDAMILINASNNFPDEFAQSGIQIGEIHNDFRKRILEEAKEIYPNNYRRQALYLDQHTYLCSLNDRNDRATMAASIECRVPFLDHRIIEGVGTLSDEWLFTGKKSKYILKKAYEDVLPEYIRNFRKIGFSVPWINYIFKSESLKYQWKHMEESEVFKRGILKNIDFKLLRKKEKAGDFSAQLLLRQLFFISFWWNQVIENYEVKN
jgi:asparagine synthase (glutamine-hydrolysing)